MKPPRPKIHYVTAPSPLTGYANLEALCGIVLRNAEPIASRLEGEELTVSGTLRRNCADCDQTAAELLLNKTGDTEKRWWYWLIEGAENLGASEGDNAND